MIFLKELSFCHKLRFSNPYIFATRFSMIFDIKTNRSKSLNVEMFNVYTIRLQKYWAKKIQVRGKT